jgi:tetratricopeptide (TPR) repeat protein
LGNLGINPACTREVEQAEAALTESLELSRASGNTFAICLSLNGFGMLARAQGQPVQATLFLRESLALGRTLERAADRGHAVARALVQLGRALSEQGHVEEAIEVLRETLGELRGSGMAGVTLGEALEWMAPLLAATGDPLRAARLFGAADSVWQACGATRYALDAHLAHERDVQAVKDQLDEQLFAEAMAEGRAMSAAEAMSHALAEA